MASTSLPPPPNGKDAEGTLNHSFPFQSLYSLHSQSQVDLLRLPTPEPSIIQLTFQSYVRSVSWYNLGGRSESGTRIESGSGTVEWTPETDLDCRRMISEVQGGASWANGTSLEINVSLSLLIPHSPPSPVPLPPTSQLPQTPPQPSSSRLYPTPQSLPPPPFQRPGTTPEPTVAWCSLTTKAENVTIFPPTVVGYRCGLCEAPHFNPELMLLENCVPSHGDWPPEIDGVYDIAAFSFGTSFDHPWLIQAVRKVGELNREKGRERGTGKKRSFGE